MSQFIAKLLAGAATSDAEWNQFLRDAHHATPGVTPRCTGSLRTSDGLSSYELLADTLKHVHPAPRSTLGVLDLACGDGYLIELCVKQLGRGARITGVDMSPEELDRARYRLHGSDVTFLLEEAQHLSLADSSFDAALCHLAFMLMRPLEPVVAEIARVLKPGGLFAAVVNRREGPDALYTMVRAELRRFLQEEFPQMRDYAIGDPRVNSRTGLEELFSSGKGFTGRVDLDDFDVVVVKGSPHEMWAHWEESNYIIRSLDTDRKQKLGSRLKDLFSDYARIQGSVKMGFPMRLISVHKNGAYGV